MSAHTSFVRLPAAAWHLPRRPLAMLATLALGTPRDGVIPLAGIDAARRCDGASLDALLALGLIVRRDDGAYLIATDPPGDSPGAVAVGLWTREVSHVDQ